MTDLALRRYSNQAPNTTLTVQQEVVDLTMTVASVSGFPIVPFTIECEQEIQRVTNITGLVLTVDRAYDGSIAAGVHPASALVRHVLTADDFTHRWQDVIVSRDYGLFDDEFDDLDNSAYTQVTLGTATWLEANGVQSAVFQGQAANEVSGQIKTIGAMAIGSGIQTAVRVMGPDDYAYAGIVLSSGFTTTDSVVYLHVFATPSAQELTIGLRSGTFAAASTSHYTDTIGGMISGWIHLRLIWVGINQFRGWYSLDGVSWTDFGYGIWGILGISPPTFYGLGVSSWGGTLDKLATFEYLRIWEP